MKPKIDPKSTAVLLNIIKNKTYQDQLYGCRGNARLIKQLKRLHWLISQLRVSPTIQWMPLDKWKIIKGICCDVKSLSGF